MGTIGKSLRQIEQELPNGFHDALLEAITLDVISNTVQLTLKLLWAVPDAVKEEEQEGYKRATLLMQDLVYFALDPPGVDPSFEMSEGAMIDCGDATDRSNPRAPGPRRTIPPGAFAYWFFVDDWNTFIHVAAQSATLQFI